MDLLGPLTSTIEGIFSAQAAKTNRHWQERMSNTAYQRQVKDLNAAGLNPMLGYMKGSGGASTPSGAVAETPDVSSAVQGSATGSVQRKVLASQVELNAASAANQRSQAARNAAELPKLAQDVRTGVSSAGSLDASARESTARLGSIAAEIARIGEVTKGQQLSNEQLQRSMDLMIELKRAEVAAIRAGIPEKEARSKVMSVIGEGAGLFQKGPLAELGSRLGLGLYDLQESLGKKYEAFKHRPTPKR